MKNKTQSTIIIDAANDAFNLARIMVGETEFKEVDDVTENMPKYEKLAIKVANFIIMVSGGEICLDNVKVNFDFTYLGFYVSKGFGARAKQVRDEIEFPTCILLNEKLMDILEGDIGNKPEVKAAIAPICPDNYKDFRANYYKFTARMEILTRAYIDTQLDMEALGFEFAMTDTCIMVYFMMPNGQNFTHKFPYEIMTSDEALKATLDELYSTQIGRVK